jgi:hypothetical protein
MSLQNLASQMQTTGRGGDTMLVHMNPKEVAGLQQLAMAHGGSLTTNPETGLPEAGFLSSLLPTVIGMALAPATGGASLGITNAFQTAALVGAGTGLMTGSLKKGLMAGLGAFGGASMAPGIMSAGSTTAAAAPTMTSVVPPTAAVPNPTMASLGSGLTSSAPNLAISPVTGQPIAQTGMLGSPTAAPVATGSSVAFPPNPVRPDSIIATSGGQGTPSVMQQFGSGLKNIITNQGGAGSAFLGDNKMNLLSSGLSALMTPEEKEEQKKKEEEYRFQQWPSVYSGLKTSPQIAGSSGERTYFAADGGMVPGPQGSGTVEQMSQMNSVGGNMRYPMASQTTPTYAAPAERPISQNVIYPATDAAVGAYTGMAGGGMAGGGIASLAAFAPGGSVGFKSSLKPVAEPKKTEKAYQPTGLQDISKFDKNINNLKKYENFDDAQNKVNEIQNKLKELDPKAKTFKTESKALNTQLSAAKSALGNAQKYREAVAAKEKAVSANDAAKAAADQRYQDALNKYNTYKSDYDKEKSDWESQTKRTTSGVTARGQYTSTPVSGDAETIQAQITAIEKNPAGQSYMGGAPQLTPDQQTQLTGLKAQLKAAKLAPQKYNAATGKYETDTTKSFQELKKAPTYDTTKKIQSEESVRQIFEELTGRSPTQAELKKYGYGKNFSDQDVFNAITNKKTGLAELNMAAKFSDDDLNAQAKYYWGRDLKPEELEYFKDPANKFNTFNALRNAMQNNPQYLANLNKINQAAFNKDQSAAQVAAEGPLTQEQVSSAYQQLFGKAPTADQLQAAMGSGASISQLVAQLKASPEYAAKMTQNVTPGFETKTLDTTPKFETKTTGTSGIQQLTEAQKNALIADYNKIDTSGISSLQQQAKLTPTGQGGYAFTQPTTYNSLEKEGALPYQDILNRLGTTGVFQQVSDKAPALQSGITFGVPTAYNPIGTTPLNPEAQALLDAQNKAKLAATQTQGVAGMASGGMAEGGYNLGGYSDGGRLLRGPGDGVSDSIPASIGNRQPARLADGEFVIPARIVSELGNGSTEAGARQLYAMMDRVQKKRRSTMGKDKVAVNSKANQVLPA